MENSIKSLIKNNGPLTIADFMNEAMFSSVHGYYRTKKPIGKNGDFITSPEISQVFGELIAVYFLNFILASENKINLVEMGAGKGTLFKDVIFTIKKLAAKLGRELEIERRLTFSIIEISESLTKIQQKNLGDQIRWYKDFEAFKTQNQEGEIYFFCNELFDCFAIHQFIKTQKGWQEKMVALLNDELAFVAQDFNPAKSQMIQRLVDSHHPKIDIAQNAIFEHSFVAMNFMNQLSQTLKNQGGMALIIDYGYFDSEFKNTFQAIKNHQYSDVLKNVGNCDLTALVDFKALENCAKNHQLKTSFVNQRDFLLALGIEERRKMLQDDSAINRLIDKDKMGELFKCLLIWK